MLCLPGHWGGNVTTMAWQDGFAVALCWGPKALQAGVSCPQLSWAVIVANPPPPPPASPVLWYVDGGGHVFLFDPGPLLLGPVLGVAALMTSELPLRKFSRYLERVDPRISLSEGNLATPSIFSLFTMWIGKNFPNL